MTLKSDLYISLEENDSHLLVRGDLRLFEKLLRSLRSDGQHDVTERERNSSDRQREDEGDA